MQDLNSTWIWTQVFSDFKVDALFYHVLLQLEILDFPCGGALGKEFWALRDKERGIQPHPSPSLATQWAGHLAFVASVSSSVGKLSVLGFDAMLATVALNCVIALLVHAKLCQLSEFKMACGRGLDTLDEDEERDWSWDSSPACYHEPKCQKIVILMSNLSGSLPVQKLLF